jgi:hypothetical protein
MEPNGGQVPYGVTEHGSPYGAIKPLGSRDCPCRQVPLHFEARILVIFYTALDTPRFGHPPTNDGKPEPSLVSFIHCYVGTTAFAALDSVKTCLAAWGRSRIWLRNASSRQVCFSLRTSSLSWHCGPANPALKDLSPNRTSPVPLLHLSVYQDLKITSGLP